MTFVTLKTGSKERRLEKQVPTTEPATGADGSIIIYVRAERALSASHAYVILRDEEGFYVPAADPTLGTGLCLHVGVATEAAAVGDYVPFVIRGRLDAVTFGASITTTSAQKFLAVANTSTTLIIRENTAGDKDIIGRVQSYRNNATQHRVILDGREVYT